MKLDVRCDGTRHGHECHHLLFKVDPNSGNVQIKCPYCNAITEIKVRESVGSSSFRQEDGMVE